MYEMTVQILSPHFSTLEETKILQAIMKEISPMLSPNNTHHVKVNIRQIDCAETSKTEYDRVTVLKQGETKHGNNAR